MAEMPLIRGVGLTKAYGHLVALRDANLTVMPGEARALVGSNGAGKSTLIKILTGAVAPTLGTVEIAGEPAPLGDPKEMIRRGVACIYQHANLAPAMSVLDNIFLGRQPTRRFGFVDGRRQRREALALIARHGVDLDLDAAVGNLPTVKQKEVEIMKALALDARVILMDEPTGWLAASEVVKLHATIRTLKVRGVGIVYISHVLDEIFAVCDTMTIMRDGRVVAESAVADIDRPEVVHLMVGEKLARQSEDAMHQKRHPRGSGEIRLSARNLTKRGVFKDVSFDLYAGEVFCITGLIGSKRTELLRTLFGSDRFDSGVLEVDGEPVAFADPSPGDCAGDWLRARRSAPRRSHARNDDDRESGHGDTGPVPARRAPKSQPHGRIRPARHFEPFHSTSRRGAAGQPALGRQPAEGSARQMARARPAHPHFG